MPNIKVLNQNGEAVGEVTLTAEIFAIEPSKQSVFDAILVHRANRRQDTSKTKTRDEVSGSGKKPWRQKGTGRARQGSIRSPQWRGGGIVFGPTGQQNHDLKMNKKVRLLALKSILSIKAKEEAIIVVDKLDFAKPSTHEMVKVLKGINAKGKTLIVATESTFSDNAILSAFNIPTLGFIGCDQVNTYDIMNSDTLVITKEALEVITEVLADGKN
jgi:large subunit ribosomal protein L4